jgi:hypothetical protein
MTSSNYCSILFFSTALLKLLTTLLDAFILSTAPLNFYALMVAGDFSLNDGVCYLSKESVRGRKLSSNPG